MRLWTVAAANPAHGGRRNARGWPVAFAPCTIGVASRYTTHQDATIRLRVAGLPGLLTSSLPILAIDADEMVRSAAVAFLDAWAGTMTGD